MSSIPNILANAKKVLDKANDFTAGATKQAGNKTNPFVAPRVKPADASPATHYSRARAARKSDEFMGVRSDQAPEINTALASREQAKKALEQQ